MRYLKLGERFLDPGAYDGVLLPGSKAIRAGFGPMIRFPWASRAARAVVCQPSVPMNSLGNVRYGTYRLSMGCFASILHRECRSPDTDLSRPLHSNQHSGWTGVEADPVESGPGLFRYTVPLETSTGSSFASLVKANETLRHERRGGFTRSAVQRLP